MKVNLKLLLSLSMLTASISNAARAECYDFVLSNKNAAPQAIGAIVLAKPATQLCLTVTNRMYGRIDEIVTLKDPHGELLKASANISRERRIKGEIIISLQDGNAVLLNPRTQQEYVKAVQFTGERIVITAGETVLYPNALVRQVLIGNYSYYIYSQSTVEAPKAVQNAEPRNQRSERNSNRF